MLPADEAARCGGPRRARRAPSLTGASPPRSHHVATTSLPRSAATPPRRHHVLLLPSQLASLYRRLRALRDGEASADDPKLAEHVAAALHQLDQLGQSLVGRVAGAGLEATGEVGAVAPPMELRMPGGGGARQADLQEGLGALGLGPQPKGKAKPLVEIIDHGGAEL